MGKFDFETDKNKKAIQEIECLKCEVKLILINGNKDIYESDFYDETWKCPKCKLLIKITTHEWRG